LYRVYEGILLNIGFRKLEIEIVPKEPEMSLISEEESEYSVY
jgi:hypothetical protein